MRGRGKVLCGGGDVCRSTGTVCVCGGGVTYHRPDIGLNQWVHLLF